MARPTKYTPELLEAAHAYADGMWRENAAKFEASTPLEHVLALEPEVNENQEPPPAVPMPENFAPVDADRVEAEAAKTTIEPEVAVLEGASHPQGGALTASERSGCD